MAEVCSHTRTEEFRLPGGLPFTLDVKQAAKLLGIGQNSAYEAVKRGEIPTLKIGRRLVVPTATLLARLGCSAADLGVTTEAEQ